MNEPFRIVGTQPSVPPLPPPAFVGQIPFVLGRLGHYTWCGAMGSSRFPGHGTDCYLTASLTTPVPAIIWFLPSVLNVA